MQAFFTKIIAFFMSIISVISGIAIGENTVSVQNEITTETTVIEYTIKNNTIKKVICDNYYILEKDNNGEWVKINEFSQAKDVSIVLKPLQAHTQKIELEKDLGHLLDEGKYQLTVKVSDKAISTVFEVNSANV